MKAIAPLILGLMLCGCSERRMSSQQDLRTEVLTQLRSLGSDTSQRHNFEFYLYFQTEAAAQQAGERLSQLKYRVKILPAAKGTKWCCLAGATLTPDSAPLAEIGRLFDQLAVEFRGEFDGWDTDIVKK